MITFIVVLHISWFDDLNVLTFINVWRIRWKICNFLLFIQLAFNNAIFVGACGLHMLVCVRVLTVCIFYGIKILSNLCFLEKKKKVAVLQQTVADSMIYRPAWRR